MSDGTRPPGPGGEPGKPLPEAVIPEQAEAERPAERVAVPAEPPPAAAAEASAPAPRGAPRLSLAENREPLYREARGFRLRLEPADLARLRELPGSRGRTDRELGEEFLEKQADRFAESLVEDVTPPAEVRVVVDPYSRQAFLAIERTIRSILSF
ncbi:MAG: hypothetical protein ACRD3M_11890 [Thermoanaerobaculia bacterium]